MKIAYFTPLPPIQSGIADYSADLLPYLEKYLDIDIFIDVYSPLETLRTHYNIYSYREFEKRRELVHYDMILYHMGNNPYHFYIYPILIKFPGITVLHDYVLHHFFAGRALYSGDTKGYAEALEYNYGELGRQLFGRLERGVASELEKFLFPLNKKVIDSSLGVIVHNNYVKMEIESDNPGALVQKINMGIPNMPSPLVSRGGYKEKLGIPYDHFVIGVFGFVTPIKNVDLAVKALDLLKKKVPNVTMVIVGDVQDPKVTKIVDDLNLSANVRICGFVPESDFHQYVNATDVAVNIRYPTAGETSASLMKIMGMGVPVIIFNYRQFAETPDDCCVKIDLGANEVYDISNALYQLASYPSLRKSISDKAREYIKNNFSLEAAAKGYFYFINDVVRETHVRNVLTDIGIRSDDSAALADYLRARDEIC